MGGAAPHHAMVATCNADVSTPAMCHGATAIHDFGMSKSEKLVIKTPSQFFIELSW